MVLVQLEIHLDDEAPHVDGEDEQEAYTDCIQVLDYVGVRAACRTTAGIRRVYIYIYIY